MRKIGIAGVLACATVGAGWGTGLARAEEPQTVFAHPERIRFDSHSVIIDGKPVFIYSGSLHYFRCPKELWRDRMEKMKAAGLNCVETYLAWDVHEPVEPSGPEDFSKLQNMQDISDFIQTARDVGLWVSIRPGPYICAEWDRGGLPGWLMKHRPPVEVVPEHQFLRGDSAEMLAWDKHWITAAAKVVKPHLVTNLPAGSFGVINWQLENEYDYSSSNFASVTRLHVLQALAHDAVDNGIDVPLFTCETKDAAFRADPFLRAHIYETVNKYPGFKIDGFVHDITQEAAYQPEIFRAISELQGGWFAQVAGKLSDQQGHNAAQINQLTLAAIESGFTSLNYYMFYGGSNFGQGAAQNLIQSYDYNAPIREDGEMGDRYAAVKAIAGMLKEHGEQLIHSSAVPVTIAGEHADVTVTLRRGGDGSQFFFVRNGKENEPRSGSVTVTYRQTEIKLDYVLGNFGAKVLYLAPGVVDPAKGEWLPKGVEAAVLRPTVVLPAVIPLTLASVRPDGVVDQWVDVPAGKFLDAADVFDQRYVTYRVKFTLSDEQVKNPPALRVRTIGGGSPTTAVINGKEFTSETGVFPLGGAAKAGENEAEILFENRGCPNAGTGLEDEQGIAAVSLVPADAVPLALAQWRMNIVTGALTRRPEVAPGYDDSKWKPVAVDSATPQISTADTSAIFRTALNIDKAQLAPGTGGVSITFGCVDDTGTLYVNGQKAGAATTWEHPWTFDITPKLHPGRNVLAMVVRNTGGWGGIYNNCTIDPTGQPLSHLQVAPMTMSMKEHWENGVPAGADVPAGRSLAWYTYKFEMPAVDAHAAVVPWHLHLEAEANGFVFLNGHNLGRYWAVGPQRDFWLPECWLKAGGENLISLQLHATADAATAAGVVKVAELRPKAEYALP